MRDQSQFVVDSLDAGGDRVRVRVLGEIDLLTAPRLTQALRAQLEAGRYVLVDLENVDFIDSSGLSAIVDAIRESRDKGWDLAIDTTWAPAVSRLFQISGLLPLFGSVAPK